MTLRRVLEYPDSPHVRRHGPKGYEDDHSFKPWLRDEFDFQCVYCLIRETWEPQGEAVFAIDHLRSRSRHRELQLEYDNLGYSCCLCNALKQDAEIPLLPEAHAWSVHLRIETDGTITGLTSEGERLIQVCQLSRPLLTEMRHRILKLLELLRGSVDPKARRLLMALEGLPEQLPALGVLRPPGGNSRPDGVAQSWLERRRRELTESP